MTPLTTSLNSSQTPTLQYSPPHFPSLVLISLHTLFQAHNHSCHPLQKFSNDIALILSFKKSFSFFRSFILSFSLFTCCPSGMRERVSYLKNNNMSIKIFDGQHQMDRKRSLSSSWRRLAYILGNFCQPLNTEAKAKSREKSSNVAFCALSLTKN